MVCGATSLAPTNDPVGGACGGGWTTVEWREGMCVGLYTGAMEEPRTFMRKDDIKSHLTPHHLYFI